MTTFAEFQAPANDDGGDRFIPRDNIGHIVVIKALEHKVGIVTSNSPNGTDAIAANVLDLDAPNGAATYSDTLLFGGAFVDALKGYIDQLVVVKIESRLAKSGRTYPVPVAVDAADADRAKEAFAKGDPFAQPIATVPATAAAAPF